MGYAHGKESSGLFFPQHKSLLVFARAAITLPTAGFCSLRQESLGGDCLCVKRVFFFFFGQVEHQTIAGLNPILDSDVLRTFLFCEPSALVSWTGKTKETHFTAG